MCQKRNGTDELMNDPIGMDEKAKLRARIMAIGLIPQHLEHESEPAKENAPRTCDWVDIILDGLVILGV